MTQENQQAADNRFMPDMWHFEALYAEPPKLDGTAICAALSEWIGEVDLVSEGDHSILLSLRDYCVDYADKKSMPCQIAIMRSDKPFDAAEYASAVEQTWDWPEVKESLAQCRHAVLVTEFMGRGLEVEDRLEIIQAIMHVIIENGGVMAISQTNAACLINPQLYLANHASEYVYYGLLNVRFFNISNSPGDMLMDTLGLAVFGVPDMQCHFRQLEPGDVAKLLFNTGVYLIQNGDVIEDGHTVAAIDGASKWKCQHENALHGPDRVVVDVNPGAPFAAGNRHD